MDVLIYLLGLVKSGLNFRNIGTSDLNAHIK